MRAPGPLIPVGFYLRPVAEVARDLLGCCLAQDEVVVRITEVEAYGGPEDSASHCRFGRTPRNAPMWRQGGRCYLFRCYGIHTMLNVVTGPEGAGAAVLIRAAEPIQGLEAIRPRRGGLQGPPLLAGPGRLAQALALDASWNDHLLTEPGGMTLHQGWRSESILTGPRIGIAYATPEDQRRPWRFALAGSPWVSHPRGLAPTDDHDFSRDNQAFA